MDPLAHQKTVLIAPLNWGLGHASRSIPIIEEYKAKGWKIILASDGIALSFLKKEYPSYQTIDIANPSLQYSKSTSFFRHLKQFLFPFLKGIHKEHKKLKTIIKQNKIDLIISDNRYGFWHKDIKSIILTHQLQLPLPSYLSFLQFFANAKIASWLRHFDLCWIVDDEKHSLAGQLSRPTQTSTTIEYIGLLSRFEYKNTVKDIDYLIILSGLEPQRTILEKKLLHIFRKTNKKIVFIGGTLMQKQKPNSNIQYIAMAQRLEMESLLLRAQKVIARSGYSTIMDLIKTKSQALLIPTPGQTEQEYLAQWHQERFEIVLQKDVEKKLSEI